MRTFTKTAFSLLLLLSVVSTSTAQVSGTELVDSAKTYIYDTVTHTWGHPLTGTYYAYDGHNSLTGELVRQWNGAWVDSTQTLITYDAHHRMSSKVEEFWQGTYWDTTDIKTYIYDVNGTLVTVVDYVAFLNYPLQELNTYTVNGDINHPLSVLWQRRIPGDTLWTNESLDTYTYSPPYSQQLSQSWDGTSWSNSTQNIDSPLHHIYQIWDNNAWLSYDQSMYTRDAYGNVTSETDQQWNGTWHTGSQTRDSYTYDAAHRILTNLYEIYSGGSWSMLSVDSFTYDANGNRLRLKEHDSHSGVKDSLAAYDADNYVISSIYLFANNNDTTMGDSTHYYYRTIIPSGIREQATSAIEVYPVPAHTMLTISNISGASLSAVIYDMTGREMISHKVQGTKSHINISTLPAGLYQIVFTDANGRRTVRRVVVE